MPEKSAAKPIPAVISIFTSILEKITERNDAAAAAEAACSGCGLQHQLMMRTQPGRAGGARAFNGPMKASISIRSFMERIFRYADCSPSCYVVAYIYLDRYVRRNPAMFINSLNVHRLLITCVLTAVKFMDDIKYNNAYFAKVGGISLMEMNHLEVVFLFGVGFELNVTPRVFNNYFTILQKPKYVQLPTTSLPRALFYSTEEESEPSSSRSSRSSN